MNHFPGNPPREGVLAALAPAPTPAQWKSVLVARWRVKNNDFGD